MKRSLLPLLLLLFFSSAMAQTISVKSFRALPRDMTASSLEGKKIDQNGEVAALIKVVTSEQGFVFDGGTLGVVDTKQQTGEIWVWVPRGARKITIMHQQLGVLREYLYPIAIEAERTYELVLNTAKTSNVVREDVNKQYLLFQLTPPDAVLEVNDKKWTVSPEGEAKKWVDFGTYTYRVNAPNYYTEAGKVTVNDPDSTKKVDVVLRPRFGWIEVPASEAVKGATVYIDNARVGKAPFKSGAIDGGQHEVRLQRGKREYYNTSVIVAENETTLINPEKLELKNLFFFTLNVACPTSNIYTCEPYNPYSQASHPFYQQLNVGFSLGQIKRYGWFVSVMSDPEVRYFDRLRTSGTSYFECDADGFLSDGTYLMDLVDLSSGVSYYYIHYECFSIMGGGLFRISRLVTAKAGIGYGERNLMYNVRDGSSGELYRVRYGGYGAQGIELSAGVLMDLNGFVVSLDAVTTRFKTLEGKLGLGYCF